MKPELVYRLHQISDARWQQLLGWLVQQYGGVLRGRYRSEQEFGVVKGVYGSCGGSVSWSRARSWVVRFSFGLFYAWSEIFSNTLVKP